MVGSQTKILLLASLLAALLNTCNAAEPGQEIAPGVRLFAYIRDPRIKESSGVVASRRYADVFWTHNDGGGRKKQVLYAIDHEGNTRASFPVIGVTLYDWEDIAIDSTGHLFIGDIGNNDAKRDALTVYEMDEPNPQAGTGSIAPKRAWKLKFPGAPFDCESVFLWKEQGYVVSKLFDKARAQIFRFPLKETNRPLTLELVATIKIESPVTGADISTDGTLLGLVAKNGGLRLSRRRRRDARQEHKSASHEVKEQAHRRMLLRVPRAVGDERAADDFFVHGPAVSASMKWIRRARYCQNVFIVSLSTPNRFCSSYGEFSFAGVADFLGEGDEGIVGLVA